MTTATELRNKASAHDEARFASIQSCDTDGFVSQWSHDMNAQLARTQAEILENGGKSEFAGLCDLEGNRLKAKLVNGKFGLCWMLLDSSDKVSGFVSAFPKRESTMAKKGYKEVKEQAEAWACLKGEGTGLSSMHSVRVCVYRKDGGYPANAKAC